LIPPCNPNARSISSSSNSEENKGPKRAVVELPIPSSSQARLNQKRVSVDNNIAIAILLTVNPNRITFFFP
jgi:hypothetical protein